MAKNLKHFVTKADHYLGDLNAPITLVEYGDFECDDTKAMLPIIKKLRKQFGEKLLFVFRHFPLTDLKHIHPHAKQASVAAEIAHEYKKFWGIHDLLFKNQLHLEIKDLAKYLKSLGITIPIEEFKEKMKQDVYWKKVEQSFNDGLMSGATGTPRFYVNGLLYEGDYSYGDLKKTIANGLNKSHKRK